MSIKDKFNKNPATPPKSKGNRDVVEKLMNNDNNQPANTEVQQNVNANIQEPVIMVNKEKQKNVKKATFELDAKLHKRLRAAAVEYETTMVEIVENALNEYLDKMDNQ